ncbi:hypothetical protein [Thalassobius sp. Cn5-15]|uniref:hypothetical protein n=1 Tax=Thalassobius sp. Cn5-15 TaxID=2917763 RepID=UPI001EF1E749|nr:hypothetical protein [Thalassobius sp. Cn5-15]MCG7492460.1 hypothetical protein [Thalassobius sp. Cn5-15]
MLMKSKFMRDFYNRLAKIYGLIGVPVGDENLGNFSGGLIPDDTSVKGAIQALSDELTGPNQTGRNLEDAGNYFTNDNVEAALQEVGATLAAIPRKKQHFLGVFSELPTAGNLNGDQAFVNDATGDPTVDSGAASYTFGNGGWIKTSEYESMDVALAQPIRGGAIPTTAPTDDQSNLYIDTSTTPHTLHHWNGTQWNSFGVGAANLGVGTRQANVLPVTSSSGSNVDLPAATATEAGIMSAPQYNRLYWMSQNELT